MIALNDMLLSRAVSALSDMEKHKKHRNPAVPDITANAMNIANHTMLSSKALRGSASTFGDESNDKTAIDKAIKLV